MQRAAFSIVNYQFDKVEIDLSNHKNNELSLSFGISGIYYKTNSSYELTFVVSAFNHDKEQKPFVSIRCKGLFAFDAVSTFDEIPDFFYKNSIAILFPYVRAYLSLVTTQANVPGIILPTVNLSNLEDDLRKTPLNNKLKFDDLATIKTVYQTLEDRRTDLDKLESKGPSLANGKTHG
jgi:preprotein translocase subunit SecB